MGGVKSFSDLRIWQRSRDWSRRIFQVTRRAPFRTDKRLVVQINDSSESVMANIAEGFGRGTQAEFVLFLGYAIGSLDETCSHLTAAFDRAYLARDEYAGLFREGVEIRRMTVAFIRSMVMPGSGVKHIDKTPHFSEQVWETYERVTGKPRPELFQRESDARKERERAAREYRRRKRTGR